MKKNYLKKSLALVLPNTGSRIIIALNNFVGVMMIARLGHKELAAAGLIIVTINLVLVSFLYLLLSVSIVSGKTYGAGEYKNVGGILQQGWLLGILISIPATILLWNFATILRWAGQPPELCQIAQHYFHVTIYSIPLVFINFTTSQFLKTVHKQNIAFGLSLLGFIVLIVSSYGFIYGHFGLPKLGVAGLGLGYVIRGSISCALALLYLASSPYFESFELFKFRHNETLHYLKTLFQIGWPIAIHVLVELMSNFFATVMIGWISINALAANEIVSQYLYLLILPVGAISQSNAILISRSFGAKKTSDIYEYAKVNTLLSLIIPSIALIIILTEPSLLTSVFLKPNIPINLSIIRLASIVLAIVSFSQMFDAIRNTFTGALRGLHQTKIPMFISMISIWGLGIPLAYLLGILLHYGLIGTSIGLTAGIMLGTILIVQQWRKQFAKLQNQ